MDGSENDLFRQQRDIAIASVLAAQCSSAVLDQANVNQLLSDLSHQTGRETTSVVYY